MGPGEATGAVHLVLPFDPSIKRAGAQGAARSGAGRQGLRKLAGSSPAAQSSR